MKPIAQKLVAMLCFTSLFCETSLANQTIFFLPKIQNEELAELAITLVQCVATRSHRNWEFSQSGRGSFSLKVEEKNGALHGLYTKENRAQTFQMSAENWEDTCNELEPEKDESALEKLVQQAPQLQSLEATDLSTGPKPWIWAGIASLGVLASFLIWKGKQPDHRSLKME